MTPELLAAGIGVWILLIVAVLGFVNLAKWWYTR